jgi:uncharacterized protein YuzE
MNKTSIRYFEKEDILHLVISDEAEANSIELGPNITAELNEKGELIGVEIIKRNCFPAGFNHGINSVQDVTNH